MVAQRKALATPKRRKAIMQPQHTASGDDGDGSPSRELLALQALRADALSWVAEIDRRIEHLQAQQAAASL